MLDIFFGIVFGIAMAVMQGAVGAWGILTPMEMGAVAAVSGALSLFLSPRVGLKKEHEKYVFMFFSFIIPCVIYIIVMFIQRFV